MKKQTTTSLTEQVYQQLTADILSNHFAPGVKLNVAKLKERYQTGSAPIREALSQLKALDFVRCERLKGFYVAPIDYENLSDLYNTRIFIEGEALKRAVELGDDEWEANCLAKYHCLHKLESDPDFIKRPNMPEWMNRMRDFCWSMYSGCQSPTLMSFIQNLLDQSERLRYLRFNEEPDFEKCVKSKILLHKKLIDACLKRDIEKLRKVHRMALDDTIDIILKIKPDERKG